MIFYDESDGKYWLTTEISKGDGTYGECVEVFSTMVNKEKFTYAIVDGTEKTLSSGGKYRHAIRLSNTEETMIYGDPYFDYCYYEDDDGNKVYSTDGLFIYPDTLSATDFTYTIENKSEHTMTFHFVFTALKF